MNIDEVAQGAELIFEGKVVEHNVRENTAGMIVTYVTFRIEELIKGQYDEPLLELKFTAAVWAGKSWKSVACASRVRTKRAFTSWNPLIAVWSIRCLDGLRDIT